MVYARDDFAVKPNVSQKKQKGWLEIIFYNTDSNWIGMDTAIPASILTKRISRSQKLGASPARMRFIFSSKAASLDDFLHSDFLTSAQL